MPFYSVQNMTAGDLNPSCLSSAAGILLFCFAIRKELEKQCWREAPPAPELSWIFLHTDFDKIKLWV